MDALSPQQIVALAALGLGIIFGFVAHRTRFCTMGAVSDLMLMGDWRRMRAWFLTIAVAMTGSQALHMAGIIDLDRAFYLTPNLGWLGGILGGLLFGFGMTLAGGCGNKTLVRLGGGNLKSLVVLLVLGFFAYATQRGIVGWARVRLEDATNIDLKAHGHTTQGLPEILSHLSGLPLPSARVALLCVIVLAILVFCFKDAAFRASRRDIAAGILLGLLIPAGWAASGVLGADDFDPAPLVSFAFIAPIGESLQYLMTFTGASINFGVAAVGGVILGAFLSTLQEKSLRIESFGDTDDLVRHLAGAALMGIGGVTTMGCTVGQGLTGMSTLSLGSLIALLSIIAGGCFGMRYLEEGSLASALRGLFSRTA